MSTVEDTSEELLVARAQEGDADALLCLLDRYETLVRLRVERILPTALRRRVSAADVMQETRLHVVTSVDRFRWRGEGSFRAWLVSVASNEARKAIRTHMGTKKRSQHQEVTRPQRLETAFHALHTETPSRVAMGEELKERVKQAVGMLPPDYREILRLCREEQLTTKEAALRMGRSLAAAKKLYGRALARLADVLERLDGGPGGR